MQDTPKCLFAVLGVTFRKIIDEKFIGRRVIRKGLLGNVAACRPVVHEPATELQYLTLNCI